LGKVAKSFREYNLLKESLPVIIFGAVGILESEPILSFSLYLNKDEDKDLVEWFLETKETKILLKKCLAIQ